ncbi:hypothetical protein IAI10_20945 [Clostridium sp. 19966]|uniref:hypothetical protein n=1 Tax=Clostridium sp. 19966 TaxID=2768166 RepID=UPI0028DDD550|nr:hypothetical protein [Clostridium sp. 19966]MDT8719121.1 hypothetical protein [Clostridium sp. 19966]
MKLHKKIFLFIFIALLVQGGILFYINSFFLTAFSKDIKVVNRNSNSDDSQILIQDNLDKIDISYDGKFGAYIYDHKFYCLDLSNGVRKSIDLNSQSINIVFYKWIENTDNIFICEKDTSDKWNSFKIDTYNASTFELKLFKDLTWTDISSVEEMESYNNSNFIIKAKNKSDKYELYKLGNDVEKINTNNDSIGAFMEASDGNIIYEDKTKNRIINSSKKTFIDLKGNKILAFDNNGYVYAINGKNDIIDKIYYSQVNNNWQALDLKASTSDKNIFITSDGNLYINYSANEKLINIKSNKQITYEGKLIGIYNGGAYFAKDGKLVKKIFN